MKNTLRDEAIRLRKKGLSYNEIRKIIAVPKSTLSGWLKVVRLKPEFRDRLYTNRIKNLSLGAMSQKERRKREVDAIIGKAYNEIGFPISEEAYKLFGVALYWGEGNKRRNFGITNSDPYLILFMVRWLKIVFNIDPITLKPHLNIYSQEDDIALKNFWSDITGIPLQNFGKSYMKPSNKGFKKNTLYYGTLHLYVSKGTDLMHVVYGWRKAILQNLENEVNFIERKWISLKETPRPANLPD